VFDVPLTIPKVSDNAETSRVASRKLGVTSISLLMKKTSSRVEK
jgi:hypothetical protein